MLLCCVGRNDITDVDERASKLNRRGACKLARASSPHPLTETLRQPVFEGVLMKAISKNFQRHRE